jgi:hypothetical protein
MQLAIFLLTLTFAAMPAQAARGYSCVVNDGEYDYQSTGRFLDWAKQHSQYKCETVSPRPGNCRSLGCRGGQISAELAKRSDRQRAVWDAEARAAAWAANRAARRPAPAESPRQRSYEDRLNDEINELKRQNALREQAAQLKRIADELERQRNIR